jgi:hypothetical protein
MHYYGLLNVLEKLDILNSNIILVIIIIIIIIACLEEPQIVQGTQCQ